MEARVTEQDLLLALRDALAPAPGAPDGYTGAELARKLGISPGRTCLMIARMLEEGTMERVRITREAIDGRRTTTNGFRLTAKRKGRK